MPDFLQPLKTTAALLPIRLGQVVAERLSPPSSQLTTAAGS